MIPTSREKFHDINVQLRHTSHSWPECDFVKLEMRGWLSCVTVHDVHPGDDSLSSVSGWPRVEQVLETIDVIEAPPTAVQTE
jgi:hypothetical protein